MENSKRIQKNGNSHSSGIAVAVAIVSDGPKFADTIVFCPKNSPKCTSISIRFRLHLSRMNHRSARLDAILGD